MKFPIHSKQLAALISAAAVSLYSVAPSAAAASLNAARSKLIQLLYHNTRRLFRLRRTVCR